jgi:plastocyanin
MANRLSLVFLTLLTLYCCPETWAANLSGNISDQDGKSLENAVIQLKPLTAIPRAATLNPVYLDQKNREFIPHVLVIERGTPVYFPNSDNIQHHVYSFSAPKRFEIKLYRGTPAQPVVFDQPGVVVLGCNIHDWMLGFVVVSDTPYFAKSDAEGRWSLEIPNGEYRLTLWHEDMQTDIPPETLQIHNNQTLSRSIAVSALGHRDGKPPADRQGQDYNVGF